MIQSLLASDEDLTIISGAFYLAEGEATFLLGDREIPVTSVASCSCRGARPTRSGTLGTALFACSS